MLCLHPFLIVQILLLLFVANGAPLIAKKIFGGFRAHPVDAGAILRDGQRLFGPSKTIRGIIISAAATAVCAACIGMEWTVGVLISAAAMAGDLLSSFIKRRMKLASGSCRSAYWILSRWRCFSFGPGLPHRALFMPSISAISRTKRRILPGADNEG